MLKLLIVDDQKGIRRLLSEVFQEYGFAIESCANGMKALELIPEFMPDLLIMDVKMPGLSGIEVLRKIRQTDMQLRVILMTAYGDQYFLDESEALGVAKFIIKPFDLNELKKQVDEILQDKEFWNESQ